MYFPALASIFDNMFSRLPTDNVTQMIRLIRLSGSVGGISNSLYSNLYVVRLPIIQNQENTLPQHQTSSEKMKESALRMAREST
ncbi:hypothetical protein PAAG_02815 [Paracoccidioides lutzii Pb01]|uniref:Uncharacterized protein n=1 Tax=Paracoccidioides lutzii (strain ATCC MYA-826 / Pb01) TaxID=502779 RepID=C1GWC0_PARBA|nr:hypothetical protein PAAG_02815 [Paracoccidioides lutzii Pb01]EEH40839.2 hypothetical protein PAAG_02815 [Paracoccidioides lutzii Pb01]